MKKHINVTENPRPTIDGGKYDTVVVGGGVAGIAAALSARRSGASVLLLEREYSLGGLATLGLVTIYLPICDGMGHQVSFSIAEELLRLSMSLGHEAKYPTPWIEGGSFEEKAKTRFQVRYNAAAFALLCEELLLKEGVKILYGSHVCGAVRNQNKIEAVIAEMKTEQKLPEYESDFALNQLEAMRERAGFYEPMEILDEEWPGTLAHLLETLAGEDKTEADYVGLHNEFAEFYHDRYYEWEQILCYFTYRHFMRAVYDYRFLSQAKLAVTSFLMIRDMDVVRYLDNGHRYSVEDRVDVARIYAREMEHSEENLENLAEDFDFEEIFSLEQMREQVRAIR